MLFLVHFSCYYRLNTFLLARNLHWILTLSVHGPFIVLCNDGSGCDGLFIILFLHLFLHLHLHDFVQLADESNISSYKTRVDAALLLKLADKVALCRLLRRAMGSHLSTRSLAHAATSCRGASGFHWGFPSTLSLRELIPGLIVRALVTLSVLRTEHLHNFDSVNLRRGNRSFIRRLCLILERLIWAIFQMDLHRAGISITQLEGDIRKWI